MRLDVLKQLEEHRARIARHQENAARLAKTYLVWQTTGWGEIMVETKLDFGVTFAEKPSFTWGFALNQDGDNPDLVDGRFPRGQAFVYDWVRYHPQGNGNITYYTGVWVGFVVETLGYQFTGGNIPAGGDPQYVLDWSLQFEGVALKDLPTTELEAAAAN